VANVRINYDFYSSDDQSFSDEDLPKEIYSNPLFDEEIIPMKTDPHHYNAESDLIESLCNHDSSIISFSKMDSLFDKFAGELTLLKSVLPGIDETDCHPEEETRFTKRLFDSLMEEIDLSFTLDYPMPPGIEDDDYDSERDIFILEDLLSNDSLLLPENKSFHFDIPSFSPPPTKPPDGNTGILNFKMMGDISEQKVPMLRLVITLVPNQEKSPDLLSHRGLETFQPSAECPMMIHGKNTPILDDDEEEDDDDEEDEDQEGRGSCCRDEGLAAGDEGLAAGDEGPSMRVDILSLGGDEFVPEGQQRAALVVKTVIGKPLELGYGVLRYQEIASREGQMPSVFEVDQGFESVQEPERLKRVSALMQPTLITWIDLKDGRVYIDVLAYPPLSPHVQTPPSPKWLSGLLPVSLALSIIPSPISSPMIPLTVASPIAPPATAKAKGFFTELGAYVEIQGGLIHDHTIRLGELSPALFERYDRDIGEFFTRSGVVRDEIFSQRYQFRSLEHEQERVAMTFGVIWRPVLDLESWAGQTDAQRVALWHAISDTQMENREL
nr:hypothetical protein [Tanacetum cinerariifolium]